MDWEDLRTLAVLSEAGTIRRAAKALGIHHSTVARRIERLERDARVRLFDRQPEGLSLTDAGEEVVAVALRLSEELRRVERRVAGRDASPSGHVTLTMPEPIAVETIAPRLPAFVERYPDLDISIDATTRMTDLSRGEADIAIRAGNDPPESLIGKRVLTYRETVYAVPAILDAFDPAHPERARWISWGGGAGGRPGWIEGTVFGRVPMRGGFANVALQVAAARHGLGFACLPCIVGDSAPGLVRATDMPPVPARDVWLLTHPDLRRATRIRLVMDFAESALRADRDRFVGAI